MHDQPPIAPDTSIAPTNEARLLEAVRELVGLAKEWSFRALRGRDFDDAFRAVIGRLSPKEWQLAHEGIGAACGREAIDRHAQREGGFAWITIPGQRLLLVRRRDRALGVVANSMPGAKGWTAIAVETIGAPPSAASVLDDHAHQVIAEGVTFEEAQTRAEDFARAWLAGASPDPCACTDMHPKAEASPPAAGDL